MDVPAQFAAFHRALADRRPPADRQAADRFARTLRLDLGGPPTDNRVEQTNKFTDVVYLAVHKLAKAMSGATCRVTRERPRKRLTKAAPTPDYHASDERRAVVDPAHPVARLLRRPHRGGTLTQFLYELEVQAQLTGSAFVWARPNSAGKPVELWVLPTALMQWQPPSTAYPVGAWRVYSWQPGVVGMMPGLMAAGTGTVIPGDEVHRYYRPHPLWRWDGYSKLTAAGQLIDAMNSIIVSRKASMDRGVRPSIVVNAPGATGESLDRIEQKIQNRGGSHRDGQVLVFDGNSMEMAQLYAPAKDMDYKDGWQQMLDVTLAVLDVNPAVAGLSQATSFAGLYASNKQFHWDTLMPEARQLGEFLTLYVAEPYDDRLEVQLDVPAIGNEDLEEKQFEYDVTSGLLTFNEARTKRGYKPVPDGDQPASLYVQSLAQPPADPLASLLGQGDGPPADGPARAGGGEERPPTPDNPAGQGSLPPRIGKAATTVSDPAGGFLVPTAQPKKRRRKVGAFLRRTLKSLD